MSRQINVALIGNPNVGKTSLFNILTGLKQKVGNYPGMTVERKEGVCQLSRNVKAHIIDLPGTYSLNPSSMDESVVKDLLLNKNDKDYPDVAVVVSEVEHLKRNLLLFTQVKDLEIPTLLVINMEDQMKRRGILIDVPLLEKELKTKVVLVSSRYSTGINQLKEHILNYAFLNTEPCINTSEIDPNYFKGLRAAFPDQQLYKLWLLVSQDAQFNPIPRKTLDHPSFPIKTPIELKRLQHRETVKRYQYINAVLKKTYSIDPSRAKGIQGTLDRVLMHPIFGYLIFLVILITIFQAIFDWSSYPMDFIDGLFVSLSDFIRDNLHPGIFTDLLAEGVIPGIGGIVIFIPQIAFLFLFIAIMEETGYMSRVVFLMDRIMRKFGLSGKSVVPLISGTACAIPAVMATRNIESWKERLITILVTPFTTCSARLPVYLIIISLVVPQKRILGMNYQGLTLFSLYLLGFTLAVGAAYILNKALKIKSHSFFLVEMPYYKVPLVQNILVTVFNKTKSFVWGAGKIIMAIAILLWVLASFGPGQDFDQAEKIVTSQMVGENQSEAEIERRISAYRLEHSYIGTLGKLLEPMIKPLGYDWKIGIALISSFAAREVFVGTLATIYNVGSDQQETIKNRMAKETRKDGQPLFDLATGISLLLFYAFAMQCMSTLAVVRQETNSWKWPLLQLGVMSIMAYMVSFTAYQLLS